MNWYRQAETTNELLELLERLKNLDTRSQKNRMECNRLIIQALNIRTGDVLISTMGMSSGIDKNYKVESINPNFSLNLIAMETQRKIADADLFDGLKNNKPGWVKAI
jgi:hypothetical protein